MANDIYDWSLIAANNANADASINWAEGQAPSSVNNSARVMMARLKALVNDLSGVPVAGGTANSVSVTTSIAFTDIADGRRVSFRAVATNTGAMTLNSNSIGAEPLVKMTSAGETAMSGGEVRQNGIYEAVWCSVFDGGNGAWLLLNPTDLPAVVEMPPGMMSFCGLGAAPTGWLKCNGAAVSRTTYANLFAAIGTTFGSGDGSTTFNVPEVRGDFIRALDDGRGIDTDRVLGSFQADSLKSHTHSASTNSTGSHTHTGTTDAGGYHGHAISDPGHSHTYTGFLTRGNAAGGGSIINAWAGDANYPTTTSTTGISIVPDGIHNHTFTTSATGIHSHTVTVTATGDTETRPRNSAYLFCIKT